MSLFLCILLASIFNVSTEKSCFVECWRFNSALKNSTEAVMQRTEEDFNALCRSNHMGCQSTLMSDFKNLRSSSEEVAKKNCQTYCELFPWLLTASNCPFIAEWTGAGARVGISLAVHNMKKHCHSNKQCMSNWDEAENKAMDLVKTGERSVCHTLFSSSTTTTTTITPTVQ